MFLAYLLPKDRESYKQFRGFFWLLDAITIKICLATYLHWYIMTKSLKPIIES